MASKSAHSAQDLIDIKEIRDGVLILKNGSLRAILMASSINFALKSADEQDAIVLQYQNFLNSLDFSVEFSVHSRRLDIDPYLDILRERLKREFNELLKIQIAEYIDFVKSFVESSNIMSKSFYITIPFTPVPVSAKDIKSSFNFLLGKKKETGEKGLDESKFQEYKTQLYQRVEVVRQGLVRTGVRLVPLNTEELIELFYNLYNPGETENSTEKSRELRKF